MSTVGGVPYDTASGGIAVLIAERDRVDEDDEDGPVPGATNKLRRGVFWQ